MGRCRFVQRVYVGPMLYRLGQHAVATSEAEAGNAWPSIIVLYLLYWA